MLGTIFPLSRVPLQHWVPMFCMLPTPWSFPSLVRVPG